MWITKLKTVTAVVLILGMVAFGGGLYMREMGAAGQHVKAGQDDVQPPNRPADPTKQEGDEPKKAASKKAKFESDMKKLQGTWTTVTATKDGTERKEEKGVELEFKGEQVIIREPARKDTFVMSIGPSAFPGGDLAFWDARPPVSRTEGRSRGTDTALGFTYAIFKIEGDTLTLCIQSAYSIPKDFSDKNQMLWVLKRKPEPK